MKESRSIEFVILHQRTHLSNQPSYPTEYVTKIKVYLAEATIIYVLKTEWTVPSILEILLQLVILKVIFEDT